MDNSNLIGDKDDTGDVGRGLRWDAPAKAAPLDYILRLIGDVRAITYDASLHIQGRMGEAGPCVVLSMGGMVAIISIAEAEMIGNRFLTLAGSMKEAGDFVDYLFSVQGLLEPATKQEIWEHYAQWSNEQLEKGGEQWGGDGDEPQKE